MNKKEEAMKALGLISKAKEEPIDYKESVAKVRAAIDEGTSKLKELKTTVELQKELDELAGYGEHKHCHHCEYFTPVIKCPFTYIPEIRTNLCLCAHAYNKMKESEK